MNLIPLKKAGEKGILPVTVNTARKWHSIKRHPRLIVLVSNKLFFDFDEWAAMAERAVEKQESEAKRLRGFTDEI